MNGESKQQELAEAIGKVIIPMVETGDGISDEGALEFCLHHACSILADLKFQFDVKRLSPKQP